MRRLENDTIQRKSNPVLLGKIQSAFDDCAFTLEREAHRLPLSAKIYSTNPITFESVLCLARQYIEVTKHQRHYPNQRSFSHSGISFQSGLIALGTWMGDRV